MIDTQRQRLRQGQVKSMLARKLGYSVDEALKRALENELGDGLDTRLAQMANAYAKRAGNSVYFAHKTLFESKGQAQQLAVSYYNGLWGTAMKKALENKKYYKTPGGSIVFIPEGEITHFNEEGAVYSLQVNGTEYFWKYTEDIYCDIYQNIYDPYGELSLGSKPRYVRAAYRKFLEIKLRHPDAYMSTVIGNDTPEMVINYFDAASGMVMGFSGAYYDGKSFNERDYPEVGTGESFVPIWGSSKQAYYDFEDGDYGWAAFNTGMAISDVFLVKSIYTGISKGGLRVLSKNYGSWSSYRRFYGKNGFAESEQHLHHWLWERNGVKNGFGLRWKAKNQMWNLNPLPKKFFKQGYDWNQIHRAIEGKTSPLSLSAMERFYYGTPKYIYPLGISTFGRTINPFRE